MSREIRPGGLAGILIERRRTVLLCVALLTAIFGWQASAIEYTSSPESILHSDYDDLAGLRDHEEVFGTFEHSLVLAVRFDDAFAPHALESLERCTDALSNLPEVVKVRSLARSGFPLPDPARSPGRFRDAVLENALLCPFLVSRDARYAALIVTLDPAADVPDRRAGTLRQIGDTARGTGLEVMVAGVPAVRATYSSYIRNDLFVLLPVVGLIIAVLLYVIFRSIRLVIAPLVVVGLAALWTVGLLAFTGGQLSALTAIVPALVLVVGVASGVHVVSAYREEVQKGANSREAARRAIARMALPCGLTALTTAAGFSSLMIARIRDVQQFGLYSAVGILLAFVLGLPLVGIALSFGKDGGKDAPRNHPALERGLRALGILIARRPLAAIAFGVLLAAVSVVGATRLTRETFLLEDVDESAPVQVASRSVDRHLGGVIGFDLVVESPESLLGADAVAWFHRLEAELRSLPHVRGVMGPGTLLAEARKAVPSEVEASDPGTLLTAVALGGGGDLVGTIISPDRRIARIMVRTGDLGSKRFQQVRVEALHHARQSVPAGFDVRAAGLAVLAEELLDRLVTEMGRSLILAFVVIFLLLTVLFRSLRFGLLSMIPNFLPLVVAGGFMGFAGITIRSSIALVFAVALGIAVDDTIHMLTRYNRERQRGRTARSAVLLTLRWTGRPVVLTSAVLIGGFLAFLISGFKATEQFGLISAVTIAAAFLGDLILLPGLLLVKKKSRCQAHGSAGCYAVRRPTASPRDSSGASSSGGVATPPTLPPGRQLPPNPDSRVPDE